MKTSLLALAFAAAATLAPLAVAHAQTVTALSSVSGSPPTVLDLGEIGTADATGNTSAPVLLGTDYFFTIQSPVSSLTSYLGDLDTAGEVKSAIYQVMNGGALSSVAVAGSTLTNGVYGGAGVESATFNLAPGTYALVVTGAATSGPAAVANISAAPEPATWALMVFGVGAIGVAMRRSRSQNAGPLVTA